MVSSLEQLKSTGTTVVADTGEFSLIAKYKPQDATTNPSLILAASKKPEYSQLIDDAIAHVKASGFKGDKHEAAAEAMDALLVNFGIKILEQVPGRVSTEVDARLSFDTNATVDKAVKVIKQYEAQGISKERVLIKIASTYEGIQAAKILESQHGIHCNLTLLFAQVQAIAAAEANATLISPFVGRILDWFKKNTGEEYSAANDPGVVSVRGIYNYYKKFGYKTIVMGASFRSIGEITELAGVDYLTIAPALLEKLQSSEDPIPKKLDAEQAHGLDIQKQEFLDHEAKFRFALNQDQMATEKLSEGIRNFAKDTDALLDILAAKF